LKRTSWNSLNLKGMELAGVRLKQLRLERGISLEEVSKKTKIHLSILKAIEEDAVANFNPVYLKGFLKIYCAFLGVDVKDYIGEARQALRMSGSAPSQDRQKEGVFSHAAATLKLIPFRKINKTVLKRIFILIATLICIVLLFNVGKIVFVKISSVWKKGAAHRSAVQPKGPTVKQAAAERGQKAPPQTAPVHTSAQQKTGVTAGVRLTVQVKENCWVHVKADGKTVFQRVLMKGRSESWQAKDKIELSVGNAGVVELQVNDKILPSIGKKGQVVKNIVITQDGLSVGR